jgi:hypothetical protein
VLLDNREEGLRTKQPAIGRRVPSHVAGASSPVESEPGRGAPGGPSPEPASDLPDINFLQAVGSLQVADALARCEPRQRKKTSICVFVMTRDWHRYNIGRDQHGWDVPAVAQARFSPGEKHARRIPRSIWGEQRVTRRQDRLEASSSVGSRFSALRTNTFQQRIGRRSKSWARPNRFPRGITRRRLI